jgi:nucleoside-diphosphate-sugar epimerase
MRCLVTGAGGFIGGHLVKRLVDTGHEVSAVDLKGTSEWWQVSDYAENYGFMDLHYADDCSETCDGVDWVFNLAADMGGMGFIESNKAACMLSVLISTNMLNAARRMGVQRFFYSSSACVYPQGLQSMPAITPLLAERHAYPADPEDGYGWEKLFSERMCRHFFEDYGLETRIARYHNVYGPHGTWTGGREKAPAAICRKVAEAVVSGNHEIELWGDGKQTRSFTYIDDCIDGTIRLMESDYREPLNIGSDELVTIEDLAEIVARQAEVECSVVYDPSMPQGVRGRCSDNTLCEEVLGWAPSTRLADGIGPTYRWVLEQVLASEA